MTAARRQVSDNFTVQIDALEKNIVNKAVAKGHRGSVIVMTLIIIVYDLVVLLLSKSCGSPLVRFTHLLPRALDSDRSSAIAPSGTHKTGKRISIEQSRKPELEFPRRSSAES